MITLILTISLIFPNLFFADTILLKSGGIMEGEILSETESSIEFKNPSGAVEKIKRNLIFSVIKGKGELPLVPEEVYLDKLKSISPDDAKAHYELGLFCMENDLLDYAFKEFNKAKEIDAKYEKLAYKHLEYINSVKEKTEEIEKKLKKVKKEKPPLSPEEITNRIKRGDLVTPYSEKEAGLIIETINNLDSDKERQRYAARYLELGNDLENRGAGGFQGENNETSRASLLCYSIVYRIAQNSQTKSLAQQKIVDFQRDSGEKIREGVGLIIPYSEEDRDAVILYIRNLKHPIAKETYYGRYYYLGEKFRRKVGDYSMPLEEEDRKNLEVALHCYEIAKKAYFKDILFSSLVETKIQECKNILKR